MSSGLATRRMWPSARLVPVVPETMASVSNGTGSPGGGDVASAMPAPVARCAAATARTTSAAAPLTMMFTSASTSRPGAWFRGDPSSSSLGGRDDRPGEGDQRADDDDHESDPD